MICSGSLPADLSVYLREQIEALKDDVARTREHLAGHPLDGFAVDRARDVRRYHQHVRRTQREQQRARAQLDPEPTAREAVEQPLSECR